MEVAISDDDVTRLTDSQLLERFLKQIPIFVFLNANIKCLNYNKQKFFFHTRQFLSQKISKHNFCYSGAHNYKVHSYSFAFLFAYSAFNSNFYTEGGCFLPRYTEEWASHISW